MTDHQIDELAVLGFRYALYNETAGLDKITSDMALMAFNAGISSANIRHQLKVKKIGAVTTRNYDGAASHVPDKELAIICNH